MKVLAVQIARGCCGATPCFAFLLMMSGVVLAQTTGTVNPTLAEPATKEDVPPGGCMPIGLTASGEFVFPIQCKEFIERERGKTVEQLPVAPEEKSAAKQPEAAAPESSKPPNRPAASPELPTAVVHQKGDRARKTDDCTHYRTYDPGSGTYKGYDGRRRSCLERDSYRR
jgi:hypothetical protein